MPDTRTQQTYLQKDIDALAGTPDGELVFVDLIGFEVPSYIDPRYDLIQPGQVKGFDRLAHHVPFSMRGDFFIAQLPDPQLWTGEVDEEKYCVCMGRTKQGLPCRKRAQNRSQFCGLHGGALHPGDRKLSNLPDGILPEPSKVIKMTRAQRVMAKIIPVSELGNDEIKGLFVWDDDGRKVSGRRLSELIHKEMTQELMLRMQDRLIAGVSMTLDVVEEVMNDELAEAGDRLKAAVWWNERVMGRTPEVIIHGKTDTPYEQIFTNLQTTSRDEYRRALESGNIIEGEVVPDGDLGQDRNNAKQDRPSESVGTVGSDELRDGNSDGSGSAVHFEDVVYDGDTELSPKAQETLADEKQQAHLERVERIGRARRLKLERERQRNRRYAARISGSKNISDIPWMVEFKPFGKSGFYYAKLHAPDTLTEDLYAKLAAAEDIATSVSALP